LSRHWKSADVGPKDQDWEAFNATSPVDERIHVTAMRMSVLNSLGILELKRTLRWIVALLVVLIVAVAIVAIRVYG
jgi:hypothetical protein